MQVKTYQPGRQSQVPEKSAKKSAEQSKGVSLGHSVTVQQYVLVLVASLLTVTSVAVLSSRPKRAPGGRGLCIGSVISALAPLRHLQGIVDLDTRVAHGTLDLGVAQQELNGPQVLRAAVDQRRLSAAQRVGTVRLRVAAEHGDPTFDDPRVLACREETHKGPGSIPIRPGVRFTEPIIGAIGLDKQVERFRDTITIIDIPNSLLVGWDQ